MYILSEILQYYERFRFFAGHSVYVSTVYERRNLQHKSGDNVAKHMRIKITFYRTEQ